VIIALGETS